MLAPVIIGVAFAWLLLLQLAGASHVVYKDVETAAAAEAAANVPPSIVDPLLRTGYHFQPPKNWINGNVNLLNLLLSSIWQQTTRTEQVSELFNLYLRGHSEQKTVPFLLLTVLVASV